MAFPIGAALGAAGAIYGSNSAKKAAQETADAIRYAADRQAQTTRNLTEPYLEQARFALPQMRNTVMNYMAPQVGKESTAMQGAHELNLDNIARDKNKALASSSMFWNKSGNSGKARGESLVIDQQATDATNRENSGYAQGQESYKDSRLFNFFNSLNSLASTGSQGLAPAVNGANNLASGYMSAAQTAGAGKTGFASDIAQLGGTLVGDYLGNRETERLRSIMDGGALPTYANNDVGRFVSKTVKNALSGR